MRSKTVIMFSLLVFMGAFIDGCKTPPTEGELLKSATLHHANDELDDALNDFQQLTQLYPKSDKVPEALYAMGVIYQDKKKEYAKAESVYTKLVMDFPGDPTAMSAAYQRARILAWNLHRTDSAKTAYELFLHGYPDAMTASSARQELDSLIKSNSPSK